MSASEGSSSAALSTHSLGLRSSYIVNLVINKILW